MRNLLRKRMKRVALLIGIVLVCSHPASANLCEFDGEQVVANQELDTMRGGWITEKFTISVGITKALIVDNVLHAVSQLNIPNLQNLGNGSSNVEYVVTTYNATDDQSAGGTGAAAVPAASDNPAAVVTGESSPTVVINNQQTNAATLVKDLGGPILVQNSKDGAEIRNVTIINATANSASMMRTINLSSRISQQMINAIR